MLVSEAADIYAKSLEKEIYRAYEDGLMDPDFMSRNEVDQIFRMPLKDAVQLVKNTRGGLINDVHSFLRGWACFNPEPVMSGINTANSTFHDFGTYIREGPKTGRNDPCPCGSGKKYKKCCCK